MTIESFGTLVALALSTLALAGPNVPITSHRTTEIPDTDHSYPEATNSPSLASEEDSEKNVSSIPQDLFQESEQGK